MTLWARLDDWTMHCRGVKHYYIDDWAGIILQLKSATSVACGVNTRGAESLIGWTGSSWEWHWELLSFLSGDRWHEVTAGIGCSCIGLYEGHNAYSVDAIAKDSPITATNETCTGVWWMWNDNITFNNCWKDKKTFSKLYLVLYYFYKQWAIPTGLHKYYARCSVPRWIHTTIKRHLKQQMWVCIASAWYNKYIHWRSTPHLKPVVADQNTVDLTVETSTLFFSSRA